MLLSGLTISCKQNTIKREINDFVNTKVSLMLDSMINVRHNNVLTDMNKYAYITYVDSFSCSHCALNHFSDWAILETKINKSKLIYFFIVSPKIKERTKIIELVKKDTIFNDRIYIDTAGFFERNNPYLPKNKLLHTFLIDNENNVLLTGDPIRNKKIEAILWKIIH